MIRSAALILTILILGWLPAHAADFDHVGHLTALEEATCATCHQEGAEEIKPEDKVCLECHDQAFVDEVVFPGLKSHGPVWALNHGRDAKADTMDCGACHQQDTCFECHKVGPADEMGSFSNNMINVHRSDFSVSHPIAARTDQQLCSSCHESNFCSDCHEEFRLNSSSIGGASHRRTFDLGFNNVDIDAIHKSITDSRFCDTCHNPNSVAPDFHDWSIDHAREARRALATCQACHPEGDTCLKCHSAKGGAFGFNPHPKDWNKIKGNFDDASDGKTCRKCH